MSGPFKRRPSLRKPSIVPGLGPAPPRHELPWDVVDRCLLPVAFCHGAAVVLSATLNVLHISQVSAFTLFIWFTITTIGAVLFYHNLKVSAAGKAVLITGCDGRLGTALARRLDDLGFTVFAGFQDAAGSSTAEQLKSDCSGRLHVLQLDVSNEPQVLAASLYAVENLPDGASGLWALVNAASWPALGELEWVPPTVLRRSLDVNVVGVARLTQVMLPLVRRARGRVVNVTSVLARVASPVRGVHCAALAAIEALSSCLRLELKARGVDVVVVAPAELSTGCAWVSDHLVVEQARDMWRQLCQEQRDEYGENYFEAAIRSLEQPASKTPLDSDLSAATRGLVDAVVRTFPMPRYTPVSYRERLQAFVADHLPRSIYDLVYA